MVFKKIFSSSIVKNVRPEIAFCASPDILLLSNLTKFISYSGSIINFTSLHPSINWQRGIFTVEVTTIRASLNVTTLTTGACWFGFKF